jgi:hypothetical protein
MRTNPIATRLRTILITAFTFATATAAICGTRADQEAPQAHDAKPAVVKFELLRSLHPAVQVKINDAGPYRLIFDLGSPVMLISGRAAADGGLITKEAAKKPAFFGMRGEGKVRKLEVGELVAENVPVMIMDHPTIKMISDFLGPVDGIVGHPFFARYKFTIDYPAATMTFTPNNHDPQNVMMLMMNRMFISRSDAAKRRVVPAALWGLEATKPDGDVEPGVDIARVFADGPAAAAGLQAGDRLLTLDGRWTDSVADVFDAAVLAKPNTPTNVSVRRRDEIVTLTVVPRTGL